MAVDVAIVGAGFTGLRAALALAEAGVRVVVLDAGDVGWGASGRTGGQVNPVLPFVGPDELLKLVGPIYFERLTEVSLQSADELFNLIRRLRIDCQARQNGWLRVDHCERARRRSLSKAEAWNRYGAGMSPVEGEELVRLTGTSAYRSGILSPRGGAVQPLSLVRGLARAARSAGAEICGRTRVSRMVQSSTGWRLTAAGHRIECEWIVLATNGYTDGLLPGLSASLIAPVPIQIATSPLDDGRAEAILPGGHTISDTRRVIMYARRETDCRMVFGSLGTLDRDGNIAGYDWLARDAERIYPALHGAKWAYRWGGRIALTSDRIPHFHEPARGLVAGLGYNGRGVAMSHVMGRVLAERILGADAEGLPFPVSSIRRVPFRGLQTLAISGALWWMRLLDRLEVRRM